VAERRSSVKFFVGVIICVFEDLMAQANIKRDGSSDDSLGVNSPFPNIIGTLIPAVRASLVHAVSAFRIAEKSTFTHKELANYLIYTINISVFPKKQRIITNILSSPHGFYLISDKLPRKLVMPIIEQAVNV
jgi:hypothetical protein